MIVKINGKKKDIESEISILNFLKSKEVDPKKVVIELNKEIIKTENYNNIVLKPNDEMEILSFVGGG